MKSNPVVMTIANPSVVGPVERPARRGSRWLARFRRASFWVLTLALVALNLDRLRDAWPPADPRAIARMIERNRLDEAENALSDRLRRAPFEGDSRMGLAQILVRRGDLAAAAAQFRLVPAWWPSKPEALFREGQAAMAAGLAVEAEAAWRACLADDPLHPAPRQTYSASANELIRLLSLEGRLDESIAVLWSIFEGSSEDNRSSILQTIMELRFQERKLPTDPTTLKTLRDFVEADPGDVAARLALARGARDAGKWDEALRWADSALEARPDSLAARSERLAILAARGDREGFQAEVARLPRSPSVDGDGELWAHRGLACEFAGDRAGAADSYRQAIGLQPADETLLDRSSKNAECLGNAALARSNRQRAQVLREARRAILEAYRAYLDAPSGRRRDSDPAENLTRLAELAKTLGWDREAKAWKQLADRATKQ